MMEGDLRGAMGYNPLAVLSLPILAALSLGMLSPKCERLPRIERLLQIERLPRIELRVPPLAAWAMLAAILVFWGLRNVPVEPFTVLAP